MSMEFTLVPLSIALIQTATATARALAEYVREYQKKQLEDSHTLQQPNTLAMPSSVPSPEDLPVINLDPLPTHYTDATLLEQTLREHGMEVTALSENRIIASSQEGVLIYGRDHSTDPFTITLGTIRDIDCLEQNLQDLDEEYDLNVQAFTYSKVIRDLPDHMTIANETILEDDSILLTININE